jgi:polyketide synthase PksN
VISDEPEPGAYLHKAVTGEELVEELATSLAKALYMKRSDVDLDKNFADMGLDSIIGVEWMQEVNKRYGVSITATQIYDYPTIRAFAGFLEKELNKNGGGRLNQSPSPSESSPSLRELIQQVHQGTLDIEQADQLLHQFHFNGDGE